jgi:hypothetical protein
MDLPSPFDEARRKLNGTYCIVNNTLVYIVGITTSGIVVQVPGEREDTNINDKQVESISLWLPDSGIYKILGLGWVKLTREPKRQWKKSFSTEFYRLNSLTGSPFDLDGERISNIFKSKKENDIWVFDNYIMYYDLIIGTINLDNSITVINPIFEQEIRDFHRELVNNGTTKETF